MSFAIGSLDTDKIGKSYENAPNGDQQDGVGDEIGNDHEAQSADQRNDCSLLFAVHDEADPCRTKE